MAGTFCSFLCVVPLSEALVNRPGGDKIFEYLLVHKGFYFVFTHEAQFGWISNAALKVLFFKDVEYWPPLSSGL